MNAEDKALAIAARIADGSAIDWPPGADTAADDVMDELKAIAALATLHRSPLDSLIDPAAPTGSRWGPLTLLGPIGEGRFGQVFRAWDARLQRQVALKVLHAQAPEASASPSHAIDEARLLARVRHPNVLTIYGAEALNGQVGIWTEFIEGRTLEELLKERGPMPAEDVQAIGLDLCRALSAVHDAGLLHRDIKAQNVMRETGGRIVLMDFGTGHDLEVAPPRAGDMSGTPLYLAPEIFAGGSATVASDIYALAVLLYRLLTGRYPVEGRTLDDVRGGHIAGRPAGVHGTETALTATIERGLSVDPALRFQNAAAFETALAPPSTAPAPAPKGISPVFWLATIGAAVLATAVAWVLIRPGSPDSTGPGRTPVGVAASNTTRRLHPPSSNTPGRHSRDGRFQPYIDLDGNMWYWELATGATHQVTRQVEGSPETPGWSAMSPDGSLIAYMWWTSDRAYELRLIAADGSNPRVLLPAGAADLPQPMEWSADGTQLLCRLEQADGRTELALVPVAGGPPRILQTFRQLHPRQISLSPDGRFVVYDLLRDVKSMQFQLMILDTTEGSQAQVLFSEPTNNISPFWTPDGRGVFFMSERSGAMEGWFIEVAGGLAQGEPKVVARNMAGVLPVALTGDGVFHYFLDTSALEVYVMPVDPSSDSAWTTGTPTRVSPEVIGGHVGPGWSADGRYLAYITRVPSSGMGFNRGANKITVLDNSNQGRRDIVPQLSALHISAPQWSPDGRSLAVRGTSLENRMGYFQVDVATGNTTPIVTVDARANEGNYGTYEWSANGPSLLYRHSPRGIVARQLASGTETTIVDWKANAFTGFFGFASSPDGSAIAFGAATGRPSTLTRGVYVQTGNSPPRRVFEVRPPNFAVVQMWSHDGRNVLFTKYSQGQDAAVNPHQLWKVPVEGGEAQDTGVRIPGFTQPYFAALSPDGKRLAYTVGQTARQQFVMENFLPKPPSTAPAASPGSR